MRELDEDELKMMVVDIGHNLRTPLTPIRGFAQLLKTESIINDEKKRGIYIDLINKNSERLHKAILDIQNSLWLYMLGEEVDFNAEKNNDN